MTKRKPTVADHAARILADWIEAERTGRPKKYMTSDEQIAAGCPALLDVTLPNTGKRLADSTFEEVEEAGDVWNEVGKRLDRFRREAREHQRRMAPRLRAL